MYVEASTPNYPSVGPFILQSSVNLIKAVTFWYNMYGAAMGTLDFDTSSDDGATWTTQWSLSGNQGTSWYEAVVAVPSATTTIRFAGTTGSDFTSDIAIDDVSIEYASPSPLPTTTREDGSGETAATDGGILSDVTDPSGWGGAWSGHFLCTGGHDVVDGMTSLQNKSGRGSSGAS